MLAFDIETGPEEEKLLKKLCPPFDPAGVKHPGEFNSNSVACGNLKDAAKIEAKIEAAREAHALAVKSHKFDVEVAAANHWNNFVEKAALHPATGRLLAFGGIQSTDKREIIHIADFPNEADFLAECWNVFVHHRAATKCGWNILGFDMPFLFLRSVVKQVNIPHWVRDKKQYFDPTFIDLMKVYDFPRLHNPFGDVKLGTIASALGIGGKPDGITGADFSRLYFGTPEERKQALDYLGNDLDMTWAMANMLQVL